jgi:hypothetical protein
MIDPCDLIDFGSNGPNSEDCDSNGTPDECEGFPCAGQAPAPTPTGATRWPRDSDGAGSNSSALVSVWTSLGLWHANAGGTPTLPIILPTSHGRGSDQRLATPYMW